MSPRSALSMAVIGEGRTTKVYRDGDRAFKLYPNAGLEEIHEEAMKQSFAQSAGLLVPRVYGIVPFAEGIALEMDYLPGEPILWRGMLKEERYSAFTEFIALQPHIHQVQAKGLPSLSSRLAWRITNAASLDTATITKLLQRLQTVDRGVACLCHGDFHVQNVLRCDGGLWIIDWVDAAAGDPLADACRSYLLIRQYISRMAGIYLRTYCKMASVPEADLLAWLPVIAAARLCENPTSQERDFLLQILNQSL